jgi:hypothetical protein
MTLDATKPTDVEVISSLPLYIREARAAINALSGGGDVGVTDLTIPPGTVSLTVGTDIGLFGLEVIIVDAGAAVNIANILGGTQGQTKIFIFQDNNISIVDGLALAGAIYLNQLPALSSFAAHINDVLALTNIGGDGATVQGYWKEIFRQVAIK